MSKFTSKHALTVAVVAATMALALTTNATDASAYECRWQYQWICDWSGFCFWKYVYICF